MIFGIKEWTLGIMGGVYYVAGLRCENFSKRLYNFLPKYYFPDIVKPVLDYGTTTLDFSKL